MIFWLVYYDSTRNICKQVRKFYWHMNMKGF